MDSSKKVLLVATGSVAATRTDKIAQSLIEEGYSTKVILTPSAEPFFTQTSEYELIDEKKHWEAWEQSRSVLHIELRNWADLILVAPLSANTLAKIANGLCDNLPTCIVRAWDTSKPMLLAPAMNTYMWNNPFTEEHLKKVVEVYRAEVIPPISKTLVCKEIGVGGIADTEVIVHKVKRVLPLSE